MIINWRSSFVLHPERSGFLSVRLRITVRGQRPIDISTGCRLRSREEWDKRRRRAVNTARDAQQTNSRLADVEAAANAIFARYSLVECRIPDISEVARDMNIALGRSDERPQKAENGILHTTDLFVAAAGTGWTDGTRQKFSTMKRHIGQYAPDASMGDITEQWLSGFMEFLIREKGLRNTTATKMIMFVKWFLRWAAVHGHYNGDAHILFRPRLKGAGFEHKEVIFLTTDELREIEHHEFQSQALSQTRDVFVFCCYTGLRFSDAAKLRRQDIRDGYIEVVTKKTSERLRIELNSHSKAILDRYEDKPIPDGRALPAISNQKSNEHLKEIGRECGIDEPVNIVYYRGSERVEETFAKWELLTTHAARRTFVVTALRLGIPVEVIIRWTGHSDYKAMRPYIAIVDELKRENMARFDTL